MPTSDSDRLEAILGGRTLEDASAVEVEINRLIAAAQESGTASELEGLGAALAAFAARPEFVPPDVVPPDDALQSRRVARRAAAITVAAVLVVGSGGMAAAAAGHLPASLQRLADTALGVSSSDEEPGDAAAGEYSAGACRRADPVLPHPHARPSCDAAPDRYAAGGDRRKVGRRSVPCMAGRRRPRLRDRSVRASLDRSGRLQGWHRRVLRPAARQRLEDAARTAGDLAREVRLTHPTRSGEAETVGRSIVEAHQDASAKGEVLAEVEQEQRPRQPVEALARIPPRAGEV